MKPKPDRVAEARHLISAARQAKSKKELAVRCSELVDCLFAKSADSFDPPLDDVETMRIERRFEWPYLEYLRVLDEAARNPAIVEERGFLKSEYFVALGAYLEHKNAQQIIEDTNSDISKFGFSAIEAL